MVHLPEFSFTTTTNKLHLPFPYTKMKALSHNVMTLLKCSMHCTATDSNKLTKQQIVIINTPFPLSICGGSEMEISGRLID